METRRSLLAGLAAGGVATLAGCLGGDDGGSRAVAEAPIPSAAGTRTYAEMGTTGPLVRYFGNWKCPFCAEFSTGSDRVLSLGTIVEEYVQPGDLRLQYRGLAYLSSGEPFLGPDAVRATRAGLAVWDSEPESFWPFYEEVMANQPPESEQWATTDRLVSFAEDAGVSSTQAIRTAISNRAYQSPIEQTTEDASAAGVDGTPLLVVDGSVYSPFDVESLRSALDRVAG
jgi:protein-disulfide isomerase